MALARCALLAAIAGLLASCDNRSYPRDLPEVEKPLALSNVRVSLLGRNAGIATHHPTLAELEHASTVDACDLIRGPGRYDNQLLRLKGVYLRTAVGDLITGRGCLREQAVCLGFLDGLGPYTNLTKSFPYGGEEGFSRLVDTRVPEVVMIGEFQNIGQCVYGSGRAFFVIYRVDDAKPSFIHYYEETPQVP